MLKQKHPAGAKITGIPIGRHSNRARESELSDFAKGLLAHIAPQDFCLVRTNCWKILPSPAWKQGGVDWKVQHPEAVRELQEMGFVAPAEDDSEIFVITKAGHAYHKAMRH